jgi:hypothetical protein
MAACCAGAVIARTALRFGVTSTATFKVNRSFVRLFRSESSAGSYQSASRVGARTDAWRQAASGASAGPGWGLARRDSPAAPRKAWISSVCILRDWSGENLKLFAILRRPTSTGKPCRLNAERFRLPHDHSIQDPHHDPRRRGDRGALRPTTVHP